MTLRCKITNNPCGTDTRPLGNPCKCENCREAFPPTLTWEGGGVSPMVGPTGLIWAQNPATDVEDWKLTEEYTYHLSESDWDRFTKALDEPPLVNDKLKKLMKGPE